jgi:hypothetical protein
VDLGLAAKVRPALVLSVPAGDSSNVACRSGATGGSFLYCGSSHRLRREAAEFNNRKHLPVGATAPVDAPPAGDAERTSRGEKATTRLAERG